MKRILSAVILAAVVLLAASCNSDKEAEDTGMKDVYITNVILNGNTAQNGATVDELPLEAFSIELYFSDDVKAREVDFQIPLFGKGVSYKVIVSSNTRCVVVETVKAPEYGTEYRFIFPKGKNFGVNVTSAFQLTMRTAFDEKPKFPVVSDDELLTKVQESAFSYFWDNGEAFSGMARETLLSLFRVSTAATGFGAMAFPVAVERGFITRTEAVERLSQITGFLAGDGVAKYHGAFAGLMNVSQSGEGDVSGLDAEGKGGDLLSTAFLMQGLLAAAEYFDGPDEAETALRENIQTLWKNVEWSWYTNGENRLYRHWSESAGWSEPIKGWSEGLIAYVLAAASPEYAIDKQVYEQGWAAGGAMTNGKEFYDITLPLGEDLGGKLSYAYLSFCGLNPQGLSDQYADYWEQNTAHAKINYSYCKDNPNDFFGYGKNCWGLSGGSPHEPYGDGSPTADKGVIIPSATLAAFPYTPQESMAALKFYYYTLGSKVFGTCGFIDSFSIARNWYSPSYYGMNVGPMIVMIENYRTGLVWDLFMGNADVSAGLSDLGFTSIAF